MKLKIKLGQFSRTFQHRNLLNTVEAVIDKNDKKCKVVFILLVVLSDSFCIMVLAFTYVVVWGSFIQYVRIFFKKRTCAYQGVKNESFSENFAYVLNKGFVV